MTGPKGSPYEGGLFRIKADMEQTCWRFECMNHGKKIEPFRSAFEGNNRHYTFNFLNSYYYKK